MKIVWHGLFESHSALGIISEQILQRLLAMGYDVKIEPWRQAAHIPTEYLWDKKESYDFMIMQGDPHYVKDDITIPPRAIGYFFWDTTEIVNAPQLNEKFMAIFVPSEWTKKIFVESGVTIPVMVVPHGVNTNIFIPPRHSMETYNDFTFVCIGKQQLRKGTDILVQAFQRMFDYRDPVKLIIKSMEGDYALDMIENHYLGYKKIMYFNEIWSMQTNANVLSMADAFILPTRMESFCMPALEAMASDCELVMPENGPWNEYCPKEAMWPIKNDEMVKAFPNDTGHPVLGNAGYPGKWYEPDFESTCTMMKHVVESGIKKMNPKLVLKWTWERAAVMLIDHLTTLMNSGGKEAEDGQK